MSRSGSQSRVLRPTRKVGVWFCLTDDDLDIVRSRRHLVVGQFYVFRQPMVWTLPVNGFMMDVRHAPREVQETAFKIGIDSIYSGRSAAQMVTDGEDRIENATRSGRANSRQRSCGEKEHVPERFDVVRKGSHDE